MLYGAPEMAYFTEQIDRMKNDIISYAYLISAISLSFLSSGLASLHLIRDFNKCAKNCYVPCLLGLGGLAVCLVFTIASFLLLHHLRSSLAAQQVHYPARIAFSLVNVAITSLTYFSPTATLKEACISLLFLLWGRCLELGVNIVTPIDVGPTTFAISITSFLQSTEESAENLYMLLVVLALYYSSLRMDREPQFAAANQGGVPQGANPIQEVEMVNLQQLVAYVDD